MGALRDYDIRDILRRRTHILWAYILVTLRWMIMLILGAHELYIIIIDYHTHSYLLRHLIYAAPKQADLRSYYRSDFFNRPRKRDISNAKCRRSVKDKKSQAPWYFQSIDSHDFDDVATAAP